MTVFPSRPVVPLPRMAAALLACCLFVLTVGLASVSRQGHAADAASAAEPVTSAGMQARAPRKAQAVPTASLEQRDDLNPKDRARVQRVTRPTDDFSAAEPFEPMPAGAATVQQIVNSNIFSHPSANLTFEERQAFLVGNGLFRKDWVSSPSSTQASDGLGPLFNARSCQACHIKDGRGTAPGFDPLTQNDGVALLLRLARPAQGRPDDHAWLADPVYGNQLQNFAVPGLLAEGRIHVRYTAQQVALGGGETATLMQPHYDIVDLGYGPMHPHTVFSPRLAQPMIGLGLLEAIHPADIVANERAVKPDGVKGRIHWLTDAQTGAQVMGRFNWKASQPSVAAQAATAFSNDMGLSSPLKPSHYGDCTEAQQDCLAMPHGAQPQLGEHEVPAELFDFLETYSVNLGVPQRGNAGDAQVLAGKKLFYDSQCIACHVPKYVTSRKAERREHRFQLIAPYTDLLLHDMGEGLADALREGQASGREWRTAPLWGIGKTREVNPSATWLHDGRARSLLEAILWHGGEAQAARDRVVRMTPQQRADLIRFLESL